MEAKKDTDILYTQGNTDVLLEQANGDEDDWDDPTEKRVDTDGKAYTMTEFVEFYHGYTEWYNAPPATNDMPKAGPKRYPSAGRAVKQSSRRRSSKSRLLPASKACLVSLQHGHH